MYKYFSAVWLPHLNCLKAFKLLFNNWQKYHHLFCKSNHSRRSPLSAFRHKLQSHRVEGLIWLTSSIASHLQWVKVQEVGLIKITFFFVCCRSDPVSYAKKLLIICLYLIWSYFQVKLFSTCAWAAWAVSNCEPQSAISNIFVLY